MLHEYVMHKFLNYTNKFDDQFYVKQIFIVKEML